MLTKNIIIILSIIVIILIILTLYLLYNENTNRINIMNSTNQIVLYNKKEKFDYINGSYINASLPLPLPSPIFKFDPNNMSNITFTGGTPLMKTDIQTNFNYVTFNNTFYGVSSSSITSADNRNITFECVFRYTGGTGVILANIGQRQINTGWHNSFIEVSEINGENCILIGMWPMQNNVPPNNSTIPNINLGKVDVNTWYQVILWGNTQTVFGILNSYTESFITSGFVKIVPKNPQDTNRLYLLGIGCTDGTNLDRLLYAWDILNTTITGFIGDISYINVYNGVLYINSITRSKPVPIKISNVNYKIINPPEEKRSYSTIYCGPECISLGKLYVCNYSMLDTGSAWSAANNFPEEKSAVVLGLSNMLPWGSRQMTPNNNWNNSAKWIGGSPKFSTTGGVPADTYFFSKKITIADPAKINKAIFYIIADDNCDIYLNNVKINNISIGGGHAPDWLSTEIIINNTNFIAGENTFMFELNNTGGNAGLLAQLIITYYSGSGDAIKRDIYQTDSTWSYYGTVNPNFRDYIQLDLETQINVSGVVIQGRKLRSSEVAKQIITSYNVSYLGEDDKWLYVNDNSGIPNEFKIDPSLYFTNSNYKYISVFNNSIVARYIKIIPLSSYGFISGRFGILTKVPEPTLFVETKLQYIIPTITIGEIPESNLLPIINNLNKNVDNNLQKIINKYL